MAMQVDSIKTRVESAYGVCNQHVKLEYHRQLSKFAFDFNLRLQRLVWWCNMKRIELLLKALGILLLELRYHELLSAYAFSLCFQLQLAPLHQGDHLFKVFTSFYKPVNSIKQTVQAATDAVWDWRLCEKEVARQGGAG